MPLALVVMTCAGLGSCGGGGGGGSRPVSGGGGDQMTIDPPRQQAQPDLVVDSPAVSDSNPAPGASFTLSVTVSNTGGAVSPSTTLRYYRSPDATITTSDTSVGTGAVGALATGISNESISLDAPSNLGTYYYGACVGRSGRRVGHDEQLLLVRDGHGSATCPGGSGTCPGGSGPCPGLGGGFADGERRQPRGRNEPSPCRRR